MMELIELTLGLYLRLELDLPTVSEFRSFGSSVCELWRFAANPGHRTPHFQVQADFVYVPIYMVPRHA